MSFAQQRLWFLDRLEGASATYHLSGAVRMIGRLDIGVLERSIGAIFARHDALRTNFREEDGRPFQVISPPGPYSLSIEVMESVPNGAWTVALQHRITAEAERPFDLARDPLMRALLLPVGTDEHVLMVTLHHIISDQWSVGVVFQEMTALYSAFQTGSADPLPPLAVQYPDYAVWQRQWLAGPLLQSQLDYWTRHLTDAPALLDLPLDHPRPKVQRHRGRTRTFVIDQAMTEKVRTLGQGAQATLFMTLMAAYGLLLGRLSRTTDLVIGTPIANRTQAALEPLIGFLVNSLPLRLDLSGSLTVRDLLHQVRATALSAYDHQDIPFEQIVEATQPARNLSHAPIFQAMFVMQNAPMAEMALADLRLISIDPETVTSKFDISLSMEERGGALHALLEYDTDLFEDATAARIGDLYTRLLSHMVADPTALVHTIPLLDPTEERAVLVDWNATAAVPVSVVSVLDL
ncbi:MAG: hypothetical protein JHC88_23860, partial [Niveispirillum sp.]|nr:hypothetical protein [Niveispirillum sp.]